MKTWKIFVLGREKTPLPNCATCTTAGPEHDREACKCLTCHGIYAATTDPERLSEMARRYPLNPWAVRTGVASGIIVLDAEGNGQPSGLTVLDEWESWVGGWERPYTAQIATTPSGGQHHYYEYVPGVRSRNRVLPSIDVKSDGGYVVIPSDNSPDRGWLSEGRPTAPEGKFREWLLSARGRQTMSEGMTVGHANGYDYQAFIRDGCPGGMRDEFFNELIFRMRKAGLDLEAIYTQARLHWKKAKQPPDATWYMPFRHVQYKIDRIWQTVEPTEISADLRSWVETLRSGEVVTRRVTTVPRGER